MTDDPQRQAAQRALEHYDLPVKRLSRLGNFTNTLFRVHTQGGPPKCGGRRSYVLRVCAPGWRTETDLRSELVWLQALASAPEIGAPAPIPRRDGRLWSRVHVPGAPGVYRCTVMSWLPGVPLAKHLTEENLEKMGVLFARLHIFSANFTPPEDFTRRRMERVLARGEKDVLFSRGCREAFTPVGLGCSPRAWEIYTRTDERVRAAFARRYADPRGLRVIHNDLWHGNIKIHRGRLHPLDFEDTLWGYPVQDLAMALHDLMTDVPCEAFEPLQAALRRGYESLAPWPEAYPGELDTFRAGRMLWVANYVARFQREHLPGYLERASLLLERFLETGKLRRVEN